MRTAILFLLFWICFSNLGNAQVDQFLVAPFETNANYSETDSPHLVVRNQSLNNNKLFLFIGGTFSSPEGTGDISNFAGTLGFDVINISYPNNVPATIFSNSQDSTSFERYRQEVCYGTEGSLLVNVDTFNSIHTRSLHLIHYLSSNFPNQNWDEYLSSETSLDWSKITVGGHSQGSGHAAYFALNNVVDRVLMFSGPNDYSDHFEGPAFWLSEDAQTPLNRYYSYLSLLDEVVDYEKQFKNITALGLYPLTDTILADNAPDDFDLSRCLYTTQNPGILNNHGVTLRSSDLNDIVWEYMLTNDITSSTEKIEEESVLNIFPNPCSDHLTIVSSGLKASTPYSIVNLDGQLVIKNFRPSSNSFDIDLAHLPKGLYIFKMDNQSLKFIKQ